MKKVHKHDDEKNINYTDVNKYTRDYNYTKKIP